MSDVQRGGFECADFVERIFPRFQMNVRRRERRDRRSPADENASHIAGKQRLVLIPANRRCDAGRARACKARGIAWNRIAARRRLQRRSRDLPELPRQLPIRNPSYLRRFWSRLPTSLEGSTRWGAPFGCDINLRPKFFGPSPGAAGVVQMNVRRQEMANVGGSKSEFPDPVQPQSRRRTPDRYRPGAIHSDRIRRARCK